jgi:hypothetical protein
MTKSRKLLDAYRFPGFRTEATVTGIFGDPKARVIRLVRRGKKQYAGSADCLIPLSTIERSEESGTCPAEIRGSTWIWKFAECSAAGAGK